MALNGVFSAWVFVHFLCMAVTAVRWGWRAKVKKLAWDDIPMILVVFWTVIMCTNYIAMGTKGMAAYPAGSQSWFTWTSYLATPIALWMARISIVGALVRALPVGSWYRKTSFVGMIVFILMWIALILATVFMCGVPVPKNIVCEVPWKTTTTTLIFHVVAMTWLAGWAIFLLVSTKPFVGFRNFLICIAVIAASTLACDIGHAVNLYDSETAGRVYNWIPLNTTGNFIVVIPHLGSDILAFLAILYPFDQSTSQGQDGRDSDSESVASNDKKTAEPAV